MPHPASPKTALAKLRADVQEFYARIDNTPELAELSEEDRRRVIRNAYVRERAPALYAPGVRFTAAQREQIEKLTETDLPEAQRLILRRLDEEFD